MKVSTSTILILKMFLSVPVVVKCFTPRNILKTNYNTKAVQAVSFSTTTTTTTASTARRISISTGTFTTSISTSTIASTSTSLYQSSIPTIDQLSSDPFMKQLGHASEILPLLKQNQNDGNGTKNQNQVRDLLEAQLSHSDGIRGFFVAYLTSEDDGDSGGDDGGDSMSTIVADNDKVPTVLVDAMNNIESDELVPLVCMNVIMPTAMVTMHQDAELSQNSAKTAKRGVKVLKALLNKPGMREQCLAIQNVAMDNIDCNSNDCDSDEKDIKYWIEFFDKWGYKERQTEDIQNAITEILSL